MTDRKLFSMTFNQAKQSFVAKVRKPDGTGWAQKWLPKELFNSATQQVEAETWLVDWINQYQKSWVQPANRQVVGLKTLAVFFPRWLELRAKSPRVKPNTFKKNRNARNWILDTAGFKHNTIESLDIETELCKVSVLRSWIDSMDAGPATKLIAIEALRIMLDDCAAQEWVSEDFVNPFTKPGLKQVVDDLAALQKIRQRKNVNPIPIDAVNSIMASDHPTIQAVRKVRYAVCLHGLRDQEIQALTWSDVSLTHDVPHLTVSKTLMKRGPGPAHVYEELLLADSKTREAAMAGFRAIISEPKTRRSNRTVPLHPEAVKALAWWKRTGWRLYVGRKHNADDPVFPRSQFAVRRSFKGKPVQEQAGCYANYETWVNVKLDLARVGADSKHKAHDLRKTFATELRNAGTPVEIRDRLMGHASNTVAANHYEGDEDPEVLARLAGYVAKLPIGTVNVGSSATKLTLVAAPNDGKTEVA